MLIYHLSAKCVIKCQTIWIEDQAPCFVWPDLDSFWLHRPFNHVNDNSYNVGTLQWNLLHFVQDRLRRQMYYSITATFSYDHRLHYLTPFHAVFSICPLISCNKTPIWFKIWYVQWNSVIFVKHQPLLKNIKRLPLNVECLPSVVFIVIAPNVFR